MGFLARLRFKKLCREGRIDLLLQLVQDSNPRVRADAVSVLWLTNDSRIADVLVKLLLEDLDLNVRIRAAQAIGKAGNSGAVHILIDAIRTESLRPFMAPTDTIVPTDEQKDQAMGRGRYLGLIKTVVKALERIGESAVAPLTEALRDPAPRIRGVAIVALYGMRSHKSVHALETVVDNPVEDACLRVLAGVALRSITGQSHLERIAVGKSKMELLLAKDFVNRLLFKRDFTEIERIQQGMATEQLVAFTRRVFG